MKMDAFRFGTTDWADVERTEHKGETGMATWRTRFFGGGANPIRVRMVEYSPGYLADHFSASRANSKPRWTTGASSC